MNFRDRETICGALCSDDEYDDCMRVLEKYETWTLLSLFRVLEI